MLQVLIHLDQNSSLRPSDLSLSESFLTPLSWSCHYWLPCCYVMVYSVYVYHILHIYSTCMSGPWPGQKRALDLNGCELPCVYWESNLIYCTSNKSFSHSHPPAPVIIFSLAPELLGNLLRYYTAEKGGLWLHQCSWGWKRTVTQTWSP